MNPSLLFADKRNPIKEMEGRIETQHQIARQMLIEKANLAFIAKVTRAASVRGYPQKGVMVCLRDERFPVTIAFKVVPGFVMVIGIEEKSSSD